VPDFVVEALYVDDVMRPDKPAVVILDSEEQDTAACVVERSQISCNPTPGKIILCAQSGQASLEISRETLAVET
jgi:hypothetical protein